MQEFESGALAMNISILNKYTGPIPVNIHFTMGGTEQTRLLVMHLERVEDLDDNLLVVDEEGEISFATIDLAVTLGYPYKEFM
jgi:hypothetical protein